ncbi:glycosyltransferase family 2 protein [Dysgonomonas sp. 520]|uniref:glycosyltransferase family 2 protein n=1 Tax=Dysgonomonas sp. 520 TaxID=2302931 RepID=UPI0013D0A841|nr:glycosyltransferase family 2 protein [Dysgonomonas sp. 520]NDW10592.1 glycosyltransferase [Dysgonomonas sp. 520]
MPLLSIITINRNNALGLEKTINSVIGQAFNDYEYLIIDGASTDESVSIIEKHAPSISYWVSEPDKGIYSAMNKGIRKASGDYIIFMNSGDTFISPDTLQAVFSTKRTADLIAGCVVLDGKRVKIRETIPEKITFYHFFVSTLWHQATFTKRELFSEIGLYDEDMKISADWKFALLATIKHEKKVDLIDMDIALIDTSGISGSDEGNEIIKKEHEETFQKYFAPFYDDYVELKRMKRYTFARLKKHVIWRLSKLLIR